MVQRLIGVIIVLMPQIVSAATVATPTNLKSFLGLLNGIIALLIPLIFALTFLTISWGVIKAWIIAEPGSDCVESGNQIITVGVIALVVKISIWGIVRLLQASLFPGY